MKFRYLAKEFSRLPFNTYAGPDRPELTIVISGIGFLFSLEAIALLGLEDRVGITRLGTTWPLPEGFMHEIVKRSPQFFVVEEVDPFIEENLKEFLEVYAEKYGSRKVYGRVSGPFPSVGGLTSEHPLHALEDILIVSYHSRPAAYERQVARETEGLLIDRALGFCRGVLTVPLSGLSRMLWQRMGGKEL